MIAALPLLIAAQTTSLTLDDAVSEALAGNEDTRVAALAIVKAESVKREVWAELFGDLTVSGTYRRRAFEVSRDFEDENGDINQVVLSKRDALSGIARAEVTVFDATVLPKLGAASDRIVVAQRRAVESRRVLAFGVADAFLAVLAAERSHGAAVRRETQATQALDNVTARFDGGLAARSVLNRSRLELATAKLEGTRTKNAVRRLRLELGFLVTRPVTESLVEPTAPITAAAVPELLSVALEERPDLAALRAELEARRSDADEPWLRLAPTLGVAGEVVATNEPGFTGQNVIWTLSATAEWRLWDGGVRYAVATRRAAEVEEARLALDREVRRVELDLERAAADAATASAAVIQAQARLAVAKDNADEVRARFVQGLATSLEQADAAVAEFEAAQALARERFEASGAAYRLRRAVGDWPTADR